MAKKTKSNPLLERIRALSTVQHSDILSESKLFETEQISTQIPMLNVLLSGSTEGGLSTGITMIAGPSKHFKSLTGLVLVAAYLQKYEDAICVFYDSEFGTPAKYFESVAIDTSRVIHVPIVNIEELKFDIVKKLNDIKRGEKVIFFVDSIGNLASKKEIEDAINEKSVADMTRAKALKSFFRITTPIFKMKDLPGILISHSYQTQDMFPKEVVSGGRGAAYAPDTVWIVGRRQEKDATGVTGYEFVYNVEKSRFIKEKSKIPLCVTWDGGIDVYSGLLDVALEAGYVYKPSNGWYVACDPATKKDLSKKTREDQTSSAEFWTPVFEQTDFKKHIADRYSVGHIKMFHTTDEPVPTED